MIDEVVGFIYPMLVHTHFEDIVYQFDIQDYYKSCEEFESPIGYYYQTIVLSTNGE